MKRLMLRAAQFPGSALLTAALNLGLKPHLPKDVLKRLRGKRVEISVSDWNAHFSFIVVERGFVPRPRIGAPDIRIIAAARDFGALAAGEGDADTLYFTRRLVVEGETELALMVKNTLDAMDDVPARKVARHAHHAMCAFRDRHGRKEGPAQGSV